MVQKGIAVSDFLINDRALINAVKYVWYAVQIIQKGVHAEALLIMQDRNDSTVYLMVRGQTKHVEQLTFICI